MAKTTEERVTSALATDRVTITDLEALIPEAEALRDTFLAQHAKADRDSVALALSDRDRDDAAALADRSRRKATALSTAIDQLAAKLEAKRESESQRARKARQNAALAVRDDLAARIPAIYVQAVSLLIGMAQDILASDAELQACGLQAEKGAEAVARGCHNNYSFQGAQFARLTEIRLPELLGCRDWWPPRQDCFGAEFVFPEPSKRLSFEAGPVIQQAAS